MNEKVTRPSGAIFGTIRHSGVKDTRPPAQAPGTLIHVGEKHEDTLRAECLHYDSDTVEVLAGEPQEGRDPSNRRLWLRVIGLHDVEKIGVILTRIGVHPLVQEDILNTNQRPKIEEFENQIFLTLKCLVPQGEGVAARVEQLSIILGDNLVATFQESDSTIFEPVIHRLKYGSGRLRQNGSDYLVWGLLDCVVDHYNLTLGGLADQIEELDEQMLADSATVNIKSIHAIKAQILHLQRIIRPARELVGHLERGESILIGNRNRIYFRDLYDHALHALEEVEMLRESASSLRDYYLSAMSNKMNEVMKVLTCISTIFLPLTFLAGIYGMNFEWMPELKWQWAYPFLWVVFLFASGGMFWFFRRRKWL